MKLPRYITLCCENAFFSHENRELQPVLQFIVFFFKLLFILLDEKGMNQFRRSYIVLGFR
jgi:hypothetical protein